MNRSANANKSGYAPTAAQTAAIETDGKTLLLSAAAGSGKTATLTARVVRLLTVERRDISKMVIVTFTVAAAHDLKAKLTEKLTEAISETDDADLRRHLSEQLLLIPDADIGTIDGFCRRIALDYSANVGLSPSYRTCDSNEETRLFREIAEPLVARLFAGEEPDVATADEFRAFVSHLVDPRRLDALFEIVFNAKKKVDNLVRGVNAFDDYARYIKEVCDRPPEETVFGAALLGRLADFASDAKPALEAALAALKEETLSVQGKFAAPLADALNAADALARARSLSFADAAEQVRAATALPFPQNRETSAYMTEATEDFLETARGAFFSFRDRLKEAYLPLFKEDEGVWRDEAETLYPVTLTFARLMHRFEDLVAAEKKRLRIASFADVERAVFRLLVSPDGNKTSVAREIAGRYTDVFVDEYQDVNPLQHEIFKAISTERNRFLVGDVKQSVYGFRGAAPSVFISLKTSFPSLGESGSDDCAKIFLSENFRCDEPVVNFTNAVFGPLFGATRASIGYVDADDRLVFAKAKDKCSPTPILPVVKLFEKTPADEDAPAHDAECEWIAKEIKRLITTCTRPNPKWKEGEPDQPKFIPIKPEDVAILLRSAAGKTSPFRLALLREGIPVSLETKENLFGFPEVRLALCLLNAVDNPRRDVPLVGLLRSPLYDFSPDLLTKIRRGASRPDVPFYDALEEYAKKNDCPQADAFLSQLARFRRAAEGMAIDRLVLKLFTETGLLHVSGGANPDNGRENLLLFYQYARSFAAMPYRGLYRFVEYLNDLEREAQKLDLVPPSNARGVRVMTIHHSKGLEFPVVFVSRALSGDAGHGEGNVSFSPRFGLMPAVRDKTGLARIETPFRKISDVEKREFEREESLRVLYVALTRARERLYVTGTLDKGANPAERLEKLYRCARPLTRHDVIRKRTYSGVDKDGKFTVKSATLTPLDQIVSAVGLSSGTARLFPTPEEDERVWETERLEEERRRATPGALAECGADTAEPDDANPKEPHFDFFELKDYSSRWLINVPGKISVSVLSPAPIPPADGDPTDLSAGKKDDDEPLVPRFVSGKSKNEDPALRGTATHEFLQYCDLRRFKETGAEAELKRLIDRGFLTKEALDLVDLPELELFRKTDLLDDMLGSTLLRREFRFSRITPAADFVTDEEKKKQAGAGTIMVQGVVDCVFVTERGELVLLDYKTDRLRGGVNASENTVDRFVERHRTQLYFYAKALADIFGRTPDRILLYPLCIGKPVPVRLRGDEGEQALTGFYVKRPGKAFRELLE